MHEPSAIESKLTIVVSQGQSRSPEKRQLEQLVAAGAAEVAGAQVLVVPHLYDLPRDAETYRRLQAIEGDLVVLAWLYDRAAHWVLDRHGVRGQVGDVLLKDNTAADEEDEAPESESQADAEVNADLVIASYPRPDRRIYCIDFRAGTDAQAFVAEIKRIATDSDTPTGNGAAPTSGRLTADQLHRYEQPANDTFVGSIAIQDAQPTLLGSSAVTKIEEHPTRRWYPVIDFSRCTNCMECIDFCLFGVYGIDSVETILVEQPDNCRKGCPACSRVCPQNAIIFPQHKTPAIAGAPVDGGGFKIDLSKLFGAPDDGQEAIEVAARERDEHLILAGRQAVGLDETLAERLAVAKAKPQDELDKLLDQLDALDL
ncbi:MAG: ferredoxin family protein [Pirellulales bacterium]